MLINIIKLKTIVLLLKIFAFFLAHRNFGNVIHDIVQKYTSLSKPQQRKYKKSSIKVKKAELHLNVLSNCRSFNVVPKFFALNLPYSNDENTQFVRTWLLRSAIKKGKDDRFKLEKELKKNHSKVCSIFNVIDQYIVSSLIKKNVMVMVKSIVLIHEKKFRNLTQNTLLPFTSTDTVLSLSSSKLTDEEMNILRYRLKHSIKPNFINKTDILSTFDLIHRTMSRFKRSERHWRSKSQNFIPCEYLYQFIQTNKKRLAET